VNLETRKAKADDLQRRIKLVHKLLKQDTTDTLKLLVYDLETTPLKFWGWRLGEQVIRHDQLDEEYDSYDVICLSYMWNDGKGPQTLHWGYEEQDSRDILLQLDDMIMSADVVVGKNNGNFDNKHLNLHRMMSGHPPLPGWETRSDDLQTQFKKHFGKALPSQALDYLSKKLGLGGKIKMDMSDWINIVQQNPVTGPKAFKKMCTYCPKDVYDTMFIWFFGESYVAPKHKKVPPAKTMVCSKCGSNKIHKRGTRELKDGTIVQEWWCLNHHGYSERTKKEST
jgi:hypothetical protein